MTEIIELRPAKPFKSRRSHKQSYTFTAVQPSSDSSDDADSSSDDDDDEAPVVLQLQSKSSKSSKSSKASKRKNMIQTLPVIINTQPAKQKKKHHQKHVQQFVINTQSPPSPKKKQFLIQPIMEPALSPTFQYIPASAPTAIIERRPCAYRPMYTPTLIEEYPRRYYDPCEAPVRRIVRRHPSNTRSVHLPKHAQKLVNRFLNGMEHAHGCRYGDGCDSDHSIDDCRVCRRLRSAMDDRRRISHSEIDIYRGGRVLFDTDDRHRHRHCHSKHCNVCNLVGKSDLVISTRDDHPKTMTKKRGKNIHLVESYPSKIKPVETTTVTTTTQQQQPKVVVSNATTVVPSVPVQSSYYPTSYSSYVDPNTGLTYAYDPNWQYGSSGTGLNYDYSSYYTNPTYIQNNLSNGIYNNTVPVVTESSNPATEKQEHTQTTTIINPNSLVDKGTYTYMAKDRKKPKATNPTVIVHTSRNPTPPTPKIIIEQPRPARLPRKLKSTTILKERTTQTPHTKTTTYIQT